jgi:phenylpropionate dioxygenase-like ring-hydroxylating dioxygenase large terminal subunit
MNLWKMVLYVIGLHAIQGYNSFFNHWICVGIKDKIDFTKPHKMNIGELPLVLWRNPKTKELTTTLNICKHMGSKLDNGMITSSGCLKCKYHGLEFSKNDNFGETIEHEGKIFWAYNPIMEKPHSIPFFKNTKYKKSFIEIDMDASLTDSAYNTMDLRHPEYVHSGLFGFGSSNPPLNIKQYKYPDRVGLAFEYQSKRTTRAISDDIPTSKNFHMFVYPTFTWSKVTFNTKDLIIAVNLLPIGIKKTRWYVTICHNYLTTPVKKEFMKFLASTILNQDSIQMKNQYIENPLKKEVLFNHRFNDEDVILWLTEMFKEYEYPDIDTCVDLYKNYKR